jgi:hypothetical protein
MVTLEVVDRTLKLHVVGLDQLWSFKAELNIPLAHIVDARPAAEEARTWFHGLRAPGTSVPGIITAGTYYDGSGRVFWDVHDAERAIVILLRDERYARLIIEVDNPTSAIALVQDALTADRHT